MKSTFVSTAAVSQAMRYSLLRAQSELTKAQKEVSTGTRRRHRPGARRAHRPVGLLRARPRAAEGHRRFQRAGLVAPVLDAGRARPDLRRGAELPVDADDQRLGRRLASLTLTDAKGTLAVADRHPQHQLQRRASVCRHQHRRQADQRFHGAGSPNKAAFDAAFLSHFGFTQNDPAAANITAAQMDNFLTTVVEPQFLGAGWQGQLVERHRPEASSAASRSTRRSQTSVSANDDGMRKLAMAAATITDMFDSAMSATSPARQLLITRAVGLVGEAIERPRQPPARRPASSRTASRTPATASRCRSTCSRSNISEMEGVDPYEASTRVVDAASQIETSYALTARIQQLSLAEVLT